MPIAKDQAVAALAYGYWEADGRPDGRALEHWLKAEKALEERSLKDAARTAKKSKRDKKSLGHAGARLKKPDPPRGRTTAAERSSTNRR